MTNKNLTTVSDIINNYSGRRYKVLQYSLLMGDMVSQVKLPGFSASRWDVFSDLVTTSKFTRVGNFKETMNWQSYTEFLTRWAMSSEWSCSFKRISEYNGVVFLELEERSRTGDSTSVVNSLTVYEFDNDDRIIHLDVYLQMELPPIEMLQHYEGVL